MKDLSIIIPVYNSAETLKELHARISAALQFSYNFELILVNDGSADKTEIVATDLASQYPNIKYISFFKNFGQINALLAGLREAQGKYCVIMDDDLQNPPEEIPKLIAKLDEGYDFVFGVPLHPYHSSFRVVSSCLMKNMTDFLFEKPKDLRASSFLALRHALIQEIIKYDGPYPYLAGLIFRVTKNGANVIVHHEVRKQGASGYSLFRLLKLWACGLTNFSILPLRIASLLGGGIACLGLITAFIIVIAKLCFWDFGAGWASIVSLICIFTGIQLMSLGLLGEYIGRIFMLLNKTPQYAIRTKINCG